MTDNTLSDKFSQFVGQTSPYAPSLEIARAEGRHIYTTDGRCYLDFISGIAVTNVGHSHPRLVDAVIQQAQTYAHTMVYGEHVQSPQVRLAETIANAAPPGLDCVYFLTTGAEANDAAMKLATKHTGRRRFIAFRKAYHGDTVGALSCFGSKHFREQFPGLNADVTFLPFGEIDPLSDIDETIAAVLIEPVQGEAGIYPPPEGFLQALRERCDSAGALLVFDEVQTGFGRTGEWFAAQTCDVTPDVITMAKGMGGGYPLAGVLAPRQLLYDFAAVPAFSHITTFGGHPVSCAAGLASMQIITEEKLLHNCRVQGEWLLHELRLLQSRHPKQIRQVRGIGLMIGIELESDAAARAIVEATRAEGLILETTLLQENVIRFSPALNVTREECKQAIAAFENAVIAAHAS